MKNLYLKTYGCQMNDYDSSRIVDLLNKSHGMLRVDEIEKADLLLLNTCSIREKAQEKVFSELGRWRKIKQKRPHVIIAVAGCVASHDGESIKTRMPFVDLILGPQTIHRLPNMIDTLQQTARTKTIIDVSFPAIEKFDNLPPPCAKGPTASVAIMEGCNKYCSYCIVPYTRGNEISRPFEDVLAEVNSLSQQAVKEITLLGQNVNAYRGRMYNGDIADLAILIKHLAKIDNIERILFSTSHPTEFSASLIQAYRETPKLINHLHLPIQSGSDKILQMMKRGHTVAEFKQKIAELRQVRPDIVISSDFIIGFPGETEADFTATLELVADIGFDQSFSFIYSRRPGTPAAEYPDDLPLAIKKQRLQTLQKLLTKQARKISHSMLGTTQKILVTKASKRDPNSLSGRTENNRTINFQAPKILVGQTVDVRVTEILANTLRGELLSSTEK